MLRNKSLAIVIFSDNSLINMARADSSARFNRDHFYDPNFTAEITAKMQVPKRIKLAGNVGDDEDEFVTQIPWQPEKIDMRVPDRILVAGRID